MMTMPCGQWSLCGVEFALELWPDVFVPTTTSQCLAEALDIQPGEIVIDLGCGSGFLSILAAKRGASKVYAVDIMPQAVALTLRNARRNGVESRIEVFTGSLFEPLPGVQANLVIDDVSGIAEEAARATPWYPPPIPSGGPDGAESTVSFGISSVTARCAWSTPLLWVLLPRKSLPRTDSLGRPHPEIA